MNELVVHQAIHGYDRGHRLLSSSVKLASVDADLLARLSDLSGAMIPGLSVEPYLTFFPTDRFYAVSRTWLDDTAPRSGCVLTHTLLLSRDDWGSISCPRIIQKFFEKPNRKVGFGAFQHSLSVSPNEPCPKNESSVQTNVLSEFVLKFFANGQYPLVWCDCVAAEDIAWSLFSFAWPSLRNWLSVGTFCLQPRSLKDDLFQIMFAPGPARPRFNALPKQVFIESKSQNPMSREPWPLAVAQKLAHPEERHPLSQVLAAVGPYLEPDPTLTRNMFLLQDLSTRLRQSSTAGIALLDVLDSVAPDPNQAIPFKAEMIAAAVNSAVELQSDDALKSLFLLNERLTLKGFAEARNQSNDVLRNAVAELAMSDLSAALVAVSDRHLLSVSTDSSPFAQGLLDALERLATTESTAADQLFALASFNEVARIATMTRPEVARGFLRASRRRQENRSDTVAGWIADNPVAEDRQLLRKALLPEVADDNDIALIRELLRDPPAEDVGTMLTALFKSSSGFSATGLRETIVELLAIPYGREVRSWAETTNEWSFGTGEIVSAAYSMDPDGFVLLMSEWAPTNVKSAYVHANFFRRVFSGNRGGWLRDFVRHDCAFLFSLLNLGDATPPAIVAITNGIFEQCSEMPIARHAGLMPTIDRFVRADDSNVIAGATIMSAVREFVRETIDHQLMLAWHEADWGCDWLRRVTSGEIEVFLNRLIRNTDEWNRAWKWLATVPRAFYQRSPSGATDAIRTLFLSRYSYWTDVSANEWSTVLHRSRELSEPSTHLRACAESLQYAFRHTWLPLGPVVVAAFSDVYNAVSNTNVTPNEVSGLFGMMDWDKAKELRRTLVNSFYDSNVWRPGDLALAARDGAMLRKVFKRLKRKWHGEKYIRAMIDDLVARSDQESMIACNILSSFAHDPDFYEPWD